MMKLNVEPVTAAAFAPFGQLIMIRDGEGREVLSKSLVNLRPTAAPHLALTSKAAQPFPLVAKKMERHRFSSQTFLPLDVERYLVLVAPDTAASGPDPRQARAFAASGRQGVIYAARTWHYPLTALDRLGHFAVLTWLDGGPDDEDWADLVSPIEIAG